MTTNAENYQNSGYRKAASAVLPYNHFGEIWGHLEDDTYIWEMTHLAPEGTSRVIGNGIAWSLRDAHKALFDYAKCWILAGENLSDMRARNLAEPVTIPPLGFEAAERRRSNHRRS